MMNNGIKKYFKIIFATGVMVNFLQARAQDSCNCILNLNHMIGKVSHNYSGYKDKVNPNTAKGYNKMVDSLKTAAGNSTTLKSCYSLLERFRQYFYDKHLQLGADLPPDSSEAKKGNSKAVQTSWTKKGALDYLKKNKSKLNAIEGIWKTDGYEVAVLLNKKLKQYDAIVTNADNKNWKEGMVKFSSKKATKNTFATDYRMGNFNLQKTSALVYKNFMEIDRYGTWQKIFPSVKDSITIAAFSAQYGGEVKFRMQNDTTVYIQLKSCDLANKPILDSIIKSNEEKLKKIPAWIVDFRGNSGGSTDVFQSLLPYFYTHTMYEKGDQHWMTPDNTKLLKKFIEENKTLMDSASYNMIYKMVVYGEANPNGWYNGGVDSLKFDKVLTNPKRIAVLSDRNNGSSGETFLLVAKGLGTKATIFGENSAGYMDYGDLLPYNFPCDKLKMWIPSRRSNYLEDGVHYSYTGVPPDVKIPAKTKDWIQFVFEYWRKW